MTENSKRSALKFSLDEVVNFSKGDEISELVSLSLEPNVSLQEFDHYISIRGSLEMYGEYRKNKEPNTVDDDQFSFSGQKYARVSSEAEDGVYGLRYDFPVDITIPKSKVESAEELSITIQSFDYSILDDRSLQLVTDIAIVGIYEDEDQRETEEDTHEEEYELEEQVTGFEEHLTPFQEFEEREVEQYDFSAEARKVEAEEEVEELPEMPVIFKADETLTEWRGAEEEVEKSNSNQTSFTNNESNANQEEEWVEDRLDESSDESSESSESSSESEASVLHDGYVDVRTVADTDAVVLEEDVTSDEEVAEEARNEKNIKYQSQAQEETEDDGISLTQFFGRKEEESNAARMKIYIVQEEDSIETIAERYEVGVSQIIWKNRMESNQDVYEGQLLYIPIKSEKVKK